MAEFRVGLDLGGTKLAGVITDSDSKIIDSKIVATPFDSQDVIAAMHGLIEDLCQFAAASVEDVSFVGVGVPGLIGLDQRVYSCPHVPELVGIDLRSALVDGRDWEVKIDNDVNCAATSAILEHGPSFFLVTIGTGLGGALVVDNSVMRGARGYAGEIGHLIVQAGGAECPCGKRGCVEAYGSGRALSKRVKEEFDLGNLTEFANPLTPTLAPSAKDVLEKKDASEIAKAIVSEFCFYIAVAISSMLELVDVSSVLIGGGVSESFEYFKDELADAYHSVMAPTRLRQEIEFRRVDFGPLAGAVGASQLWNA